MVQDPIDYRGVLDDRQEPHLAATVGADERVHFVDLLNQARPGAVCSLAGPGIRFDGFVRRNRRRRRRTQLQNLFGFSESVDL